MKLFVDVHYRDKIATIYSEKFCTTIKFETIDNLVHELKYRTMVRSYNELLGEYVLVQVHELYIDISNVGYELCYCLDRKGVGYHQIAGKSYKNALPVILN